MLTPKQKKCIQLMIAGELTQKEIAEQVKITEQTICNWKKQTEFIDELNEGIKTKISYLAPKALRKQEKLLNASSEMVSYMTSKDILDRAGFKASDKVNVDAKLVIPVFSGEDEFED